MTDNDDDFTVQLENLRQDMIHGVQSIDRAIQVCQDYQGRAESLEEQIEAVRYAQQRLLTKFQQVLLPPQPVAYDPLPEDEDNFPEFLRSVGRGARNFVREHTDDYLTNLNGYLTRQ